MIKSLFWSILTIAMFKLVNKIFKKYRIRVVHPILVIILLLIKMLLVTKTNYKIYIQSTEIIVKMLGPIVVMLAIPIYKNISYLKMNLVPILIGITTSILTSLISITFLGFIFGLNKVIIISLLPKSITTPMALEVTKQLQGNQGLTVISVIFTGIIGASLAEITLKIFNIKSPIATGIGIGASAHGIGTSKAIELGETQGASSSISMALTGLITVITYNLLNMLITF